MVATPLLLNSDTIQHHMTTADARPYSLTDSRLTHTELNTGSMWSTDLLRTCRIAVHHTSNMIAFEMVENSLRHESGKDTTDQPVI